MQCNAMPYTIVEAFGAMIHCKAGSHVLQRQQLGARCREAQQRGRTVS